MTGRCAVAAQSGGHCGGVHKMTFAHLRWAIKRLASRPVGNWNCHSAGKHRLMGIRWAVRPNDRASLHSQPISYFADAGSLISDSIRSADPQQQFLQASLVGNSP
jgi:hypothetical protein